MRKTPLPFTRAQYRPLKNIGGDRLENICCLHPICQSNKFPLFDVPQPFCFDCLNWLPLEWQKEIYEACKDARGYQFRNEAPPSFRAFAFAVRRVMRLTPRRRLVMTNKKTRKVIQQPEPATWADLGLEPRGKHIDRHTAARNDLSPLLKFYPDERSFARA